MGLLIFVNGEKITSRIQYIDKTRANEVVKTNSNAIFIENINDFEYPTDGKNYNAVYRNGEIVYEEIDEPEQQETQLDRIEKNVVTLVNDVSVTDVLLGVE